MPAPRFYGQPKIHKPGVPIRPIVSYSSFLLYNVHKYVASILKAYVKDEDTKARNFNTFLNYIRNVAMEGKEIMVSFGVTSLCRNVPIFDTLERIKDYVNNDNQFTRKTTIPEGTFLDPVNLVLTVTWHTFNSQFYQSTDVVAEIYMQAHEHTAIYTALHPLKVWERFADEVYSIMTCTYLENFFYHINNHN